MKKQRVVIITGMHRSGTSLISNLLQKAGVNIGDNLLGPDRGNLRGHFEDADFYHFHERALSRFGQTLLVQTPAALGEITPTETEEALKLIKKRSNYQMWGWKDPRTALFLDFWRSALPQACYIFIYRHPIEVTLSLLRRGSDLEAVVEPLIGLRTWQVYNQAILNFYQKHSELCLLVHISGFTTNIKASTELVAKKLSLPLCSEGTQTLYHATELKQITVPGEALNILRQLAPETVYLYEQLEAEADLPEQNSHVTQGHTYSELLELQTVVSKLMNNNQLKESALRPLFSLLLAVLDTQTMTHLAANTHPMVLEQIQRNSWFTIEHQNLKKLAEEHEKQLQHWQDVVKDREDQIYHWKCLAEEREAMLHRIDKYLTRFKLKPIIQLAKHLGFFRLV